MVTIPDSVRGELRSRMRAQRGGARLGCSSNSLFEPHVAGEVVFSEKAGPHVFLIDTGDGLTLRFWYSSPGTGTRVAQVDLAQMQPAPWLTLTFKWSPDRVDFVASDRDHDGNSISATGVNSATRRYGLVGAGILTMAPFAEQVSLRIDGVKVFETPAIEVWKSTVEAIDIALSRTSTEARFGNVQSNMVLVMLDTGFETYLRTRFGELEAEGVKPNEQALALKFMLVTERQGGGFEALKASAAAENVSVFGLLLSRIGFLNFDRAKTAYSKAFEIKFGELASGDEINRMRRLLHYRHRIVHESASLQVLNDDETPSPDALIFSTPALAATARDVFDVFVNRVHARSLRMPSEVSSFEHRAESASPNAPVIT
jgi:hypothetical protein